MASAATVFMQSFRRALGERGLDRADSPHAASTGTSSGERMPSSDRWQANTSATSAADW